MTNKEPIGTPRLPMSGDPQVDPDTDPRAEEIKRALFDRYKAIAGIEGILRETEPLTETLSPEFIIPSPMPDYKVFGAAAENEPIFAQGGEIPLYQYPNSDRKLAYINEPNWTTAVILPADQPIDIYTDDARNCSILVMRVEKDGKPSIVLSHVYQRSPVQQIDHIKDYLQNKGYQITDVVFSPREDSGYREEAVAAVESASENTHILLRPRVTEARALVSHEGWLINAGLKKNRKSIVEAWAE